MFTIDASVYINALNPFDPGSSDSRRFLERVHRGGLPVFSPTLLLVELAAAVARVFDDEEKGLAYAEAVRLLPGHTWLALDQAAAEESLALAARHRLRAGDAVYAAVARRHDAVLVTLDRQQRQRPPPAVRVFTPGEVLAEMGE